VKITIELSELVTKKYQKLAIDEFRSLEAQIAYLLTKQSESWKEVSNIATMVPPVKLKAVDLTVKKTSAQYAKDSHDKKSRKLLDNFLYVTESCDVSENFVKLFIRMGSCGSTFKRRNFTGLLHDALYDSLLKVMASEGYLIPVREGIRKDWYYRKTDKFVKDFEQALRFLAKSNTGQRALISNA
jgi:hypothetical protein